MRPLRVDERRQTGIVAFPTRRTLAACLQPHELGVALLETCRGAIRGADPAVALEMEQRPCRQAVA